MLSRITRGRRIESLRLPISKVHFVRFKTEDDVGVVLDGTYVRQKVKK